MKEVSHRIFLEMDMNSLIFMDPNHGWGTLSKDFFEILYPHLIIL